MKVYLVENVLENRRDSSIERDIIEGAGHELVVSYCPHEDDVIKNCSDADAILNIYTQMGEKSMEALKNCKVMVRYGIGFDTFDVEAATKRGIRICNIPHYCIPEVATHTTALILAATRNLLYYTMKIRAGQYRNSDGEYFKMRRPSTQTVGIIGFGNIARTIAGQVKGVGYNVIAYDPYLDDEVFESAEVERVELDDIFSRADVISTNAPYTKETHHIINKDSIAKMKDGVVIVNTARGPLIEEAALVEGLESGKIGAAGIDVFEVEPFVPEDHPLFHMNNVILSPHAAYNSAEASVELQRQVAMVAVAVLGGETPNNIVNKRELGL